ncbi:cystathionine beta-lyase [Streptococcus sciuri]|uniref:Cystathionine beta-lyase n=1 Tax=Streptococcus sciuri TaxID=2973939 RepID=A0ABT2F4R4_9STRE|nr:cystathionine beta-lyase [Streptococcus sciuri]MCS4487387.1 cystathionine beta-lyase [Streptococcus sciuri]
MVDYIDLALRYGGFTSLDRVYLTNCLERLSDDDKLTLITPPPSVINAYFAEIYQKQSPKAATNYYFELSKAFHLFIEQPSFLEVKPFVRLNLSGKSYGFAYMSDKELAQVFSETDEPISTSVLLEIAHLFPHYVVYTVENKIMMREKTFSERILLDETPKDCLLGQVSRLENDVIRITSFNHEELLDLAKVYEGQRYYQSDGKQATLYIENRKD